MKLKLILIGIILLLLLGGYILFGMYSKERTERKNYQQNTYELLKDTTEKAAIIQVNKKEFRKLFGKHDSVLKENNILKKDVKQLHAIKYKIGSIKTVKTDTIWADTSKNDNQNIMTPQKDYLMAWYFDHGCFQNLVTYDPSINQATDSLIGEIQINRIVSIVRPNLWFWRLKWRKSKWATETKVISNCPELKIKENTVIEVR